MKKVIIIIIFCSISCLAQDSTRFDGYAWKSTNSIILVPYMTGVFDGLSLGTTLTFSEYPQNSVCLQTGTKNIEDFYQRLDNLKVGDVYQAINSFYSDSTNLKVLFTNAFIVGVYKASKADDKYIQKLTELYRKEDSDVGK